jgi:Leucine-rich repeat (LRR) protein
MGCEISGLSSLRTLDVSYCELKYLFLEFIDLLSLKELYLEENQFEFPLFKVIKRGLYATMHYLTSEKKKKDAAKVILQVFNLPEKIQTPFKQYIACFNDMISAVNEEEIKFDINFINQDIQPDIELKVEVESYLYDFLKFIKQKIDSLKTETTDEAKLTMIDLQAIELRKHIQSFNTSLDSKMGEIKKIQEQIEGFYKLLGDKDS